MEILGEPSGVHKAVELIAGQLRKFLVDRSVLPLFEMPVSGRMIPFILLCFLLFHLFVSLQPPMPGLHNEQNGPPMPPWGPPTGAPGGPPSYGGGNPPFMGARPHDKFYPPSDLPPMDKQPYHNLTAYGREAPPPAHLPQSSLITQVCSYPLF